MNSKETKTEDFGASHCSFPVENWQIDHDTLMRIIDQKNWAIFVLNECRKAIREGRLTGGNPDAFVESFSELFDGGTPDSLANKLTSVL